MGESLDRQGAFVEPREHRKKEPVAVKIASCKELVLDVSDSVAQAAVTTDALVEGLLPRLSPFDKVPTGAHLVPIHPDVQNVLRQERSSRIIDWNSPEEFLRRLEITRTQEFVPPVPLHNDSAIAQLNRANQVVSFEDIRIHPPVATKERHSRNGNNTSLESPIMGRARIPFALGSMPDVGSSLAYATVAQANGMVFVSRDKVLADVDHQVTVARDVIAFLRTVTLPEQLLPNEEHLRRFWKIMGREEAFDQHEAAVAYEQELRESWVANVGAAIESSPRGIDRAKALYAVGVRMFRIYSPEGGREIVERVKDLRKEFAEDSSVQIVAGQVMDLETAKAAQDAGATAVMIGIAGGRRCTTGVATGLPIDTPNLLGKLRGKLRIPIGIEGGGVGTNTLEALALGASFVCKPGEIGISYEGMGGEYALQDEVGNYWMLYGGEASDAAKWWRDLVDDFGRAMYVEGETGFAFLGKELHSLTRTIATLRENVSTALVFHRAKTVTELHTRDMKDDIVQITPSAAGLSVAYGK